MFLMLVLVCGLGACSSPEASRTRGGGAGGDVGNRAATVEIHAGAQPYYHTPCQLPVDCHSIAATPGTARQALLKSTTHKEP
jgi:hypothetical protein